ARSGRRRRGAAPGTPLTPAPADRGANPPVAGHGVLNPPLVPRQLLSTGGQRPPSFSAENFMDEKKDEGRAFRVTDRRRFSESGEAREDAPPEAPRDVPVAGPAERERP